MKRLGHASTPESAVALMRRAGCGWVELRPCLLRRGFVVYGQVGW